MNLREAAYPFIADIPNTVVGVLEVCLMSVWDASQLLRKKEGKVEGGRQGSALSRSELLYEFKSDEAFEAATLPTPYTTFHPPIIYQRPPSFY